VDAPAVAAPPAEAPTRPAMSGTDLPAPAPQSPDRVPPSPAPEFQLPREVARATDAPPASAPNSVRMDAPLGSPRWRDDLAGHVMLMVRHADSEAEIRVTPPELGPIHARVSIDNGIASVSFTAPAQETRDALDASLAGLRDRLAESGLTLGEASVSGERASHFEQHAARDPGAGMSDAGAGIAATPAEAVLPPAAVRRVRLDGLVDLYA
jgi:flagellar hook-length control protein FliK